MSLNINTNISALTAHRSMMKADNEMKTSLQRLSTGLRINSASDDASGMTIADALKSQHRGLAQGIRNANDAVSIVQTADGALEESINIIKSKAIQAGHVSTAKLALNNKDGGKVFGDKKAADMSTVGYLKLTQSGSSQFSIEGTTAGGTKNAITLSRELKVAGQSTLAAGSTIAKGSELKAGSVVGGNATVNFSVKNALSD